MARHQEDVTSTFKRLDLSGDTSPELGSIFATSPELSPFSPFSTTGSLHSSADADKGNRGWWKPKSGSSGRRVSAATTASSGSSGTMTSAASLSSLGSGPMVDNSSIYRLPSLTQDKSDSKRYSPSMSLSLGKLDEHEALKSPMADDRKGSDAFSVHSSIASPGLDNLRKLPSLGRGDSRTESRAGVRPQDSAKPLDAHPLAELEMSARKYQGYWRAAFTANVPIAAAMCGCLLLVAGPGAVTHTKITETTSGMETAARLVGLLSQAASPAQLLQTVFAHEFQDVVFALKLSIQEARLPMVPPKTAFSIYKEISETKDQPKKRAKLWEKVAKLLKKVPQETMVSMMFLLSVGRKLSARGLEVNGRSAGLYLLETFWPQIGSQGMYASNTSAGDSASALLLQNYNEFPDELPVIFQAVNYRFESGSRCNLMSLLSSKKSSGSAGASAGAGAHRSIGSSGS